MNSAALGLAVQGRYRLLGVDVCMGDHKPVALDFKLQQSPDPFLSGAQIHTSSAQNDSPPPAQSSRERKFFIIAAAAAVVAAIFVASRSSWKS